MKETQDWGYAVELCHQKFALFYLDENVYTESIAFPNHFIEIVQGIKSVIRSQMLSITNKTNLLTYFIVFFHLHTYSAWTSKANKSLYYLLTLACIRTKSSMKEDVKLLSSLFTALSCIWPASHGSPYLNSNLMKSIQTDLSFLPNRCVANSWGRRACFNEISDCMISSDAIFLWHSNEKGGCRHRSSYALRAAWIPGVKINLLNWNIYWVI